MIDKNKFGQLIKSIRDKHKLTQKELADLFSPSLKQQSINAWEKGTCTPNQKHWFKIAELAGIDSNQLYSYVNKNIEYDNESDFALMIVEEVSHLNNEQIERLMQAVTHEYLKRKKIEEYTLAMLKSGVDSWNDWRKTHKKITPILHNIEFKEYGHYRFDNYDFSNMIINRCSAEELTFNNANFAHTDLSNTIFTRSNLTYASFQNSNLENAVINECDLSLATFVETDLTNTSFLNCKIKGTNFMLTNLSVIKASKNLMINDDLVSFDNLSDAIIQQLES